MYAEQNGKVARLSTVANKTLDNLDDVKLSIEKQGILIACLTEFASVSQALNRY